MFTRSEEESRFQQAIREWPSALSSTGGPTLALSLPLSLSAGEEHHYGPPPRAQRRTPLILVVTGPETLSIFVGLENRTRSQTHVCEGQLPVLRPLSADGKLGRNSDFCIECFIPLGLNWTECMYMGLHGFLQMMQVSGFSFYNILSCTVAIYRLIYREIMINFIV